MTCQQEIGGDLFVHHFLPSPQTTSDSAAYLRKFHRLLHNIVIISINKLLQRGGILITFRWVKQLNISAINKGNLFVALVFYGMVCLQNFIIFTKS